MVRRLRGERIFFAPLQMLKLHFKKSCFHILIKAHFIILISL
jgi:hypothetical protein